MKRRKTLNISVSLYRRCQIGKLKAFDAVDGPAKLAKGLGIRKQATSHWDVIPAERVVEVERVTGVPRDELRPDLFDGYARIDEPPRRKTA